MISYPNLSHEHRRQLLEESGIAPEVVAERETFTAQRGKDVPQDHGWLPRKPGIVLPVHPLDGGIFHRLRLDSPGRLPKYMQPKGHANRLDVHPRQHERIRQPGGMRYVTEGEKKVDAGVSRGLLMVGQSGVFNGQRDKGAALIEDWDLLPIEGEKYSILYDSDIESNPMVQLAADRQASLLRGRGAEVFITLLPPMTDGSKQGLDDFFANGGTVKELELLTRPYDANLVAEVRMSRDQNFRALVEDLEHRYWEFGREHGRKSTGGETAQDVFLKLREAAAKHGKLHPDGVRVQKAHGPLALEVGISSRTLVKCIARLEEWGVLYRDNEGRKSKQAGHFVLRAGVKQYGGRGTAEEEATRLLQESVPCTLHPRAPRLMWSRAKWKPTKKMIRDHRLGKLSILPEPREGVRRLGKPRGHLFDALDCAGGTLTLAELGNITGRRPRDLVRRKTSDKGRDGLLIWPIEAGIVRVEGDTVSLTDDWLQRVEIEREVGEEIEMSEVARRRYKEKSRAYHERNKPPESKPSAAGLAAVERGQAMRTEKRLNEHEEQQAKARAAELEAKRFAKRFVYERLRELGQIRLELLQEVLHDAGGVPTYALPAAKSLGCDVERLPEYGNAEFVFAPRGETGRREGAA